MIIIILEGLSLLSGMIIVLYIDLDTLVYLCTCYVGCIASLRQLVILLFKLPYLKTKKKSEKNYLTVNAHLYHCDQFR